jgi:hypothetical protein
MAEERRRIVFDNKIPLTWLLSSAGSILFLLGILLWNVAAQSNKLDQLILQTDKLEKAAAIRDAKFEDLSRESYATKRNEDIMNMRIEALEKARSK